jgi:hypothetical protein
MKNRTPALFVGIVWSAIVLAMASPPVHGQEFRVDTELFLNQEKKPFLEQLTIFTADGTIYDFCLGERPETTVFDPRHGRFTLLDETRKVKASVATQELLDFSLALEKQAAQQRDPLIAFCAAPNFETMANPVEQNGQTLTELSLSGRPLSYVARGHKPQHVEAVKAYRHFADWCARLNASQEGNLPPAARIALNQALAEHELLPLEITRTIPAAGPLTKKQEIKSQHRWNWALAGQDRKKIERAGDMMATFQLVSYVEYCGVQSKDPTRQARR